MQLRVSSLYVRFGIAMSLIAVVIAVGFRPDTVGADTFGYLSYYKRIIQENLTAFRYDYLFEIIIRVLAFLNFSGGAFLTFFTLINFINLIYLTKNMSDYLLSKVSFYRLFFLLVSMCCLSPFFFASQTNVLRQGVSIPLLFICYLFLLERRRTILILGLAFLALGFHHTTIFYLIFAPLLYFKYSLIIRTAFIMAFFYSTGIVRYLLQHFCFGFYNKIMTYGDILGHKTGLRYDFVLFTLGAGLMFHWLGNIFLRDVEQKQFFNLLKIYWILTLPFFFFGFGFFSDRYLLPPWIYLSILAAVFFGFALKMRISIYWYYLLFFLSTCYFILKAQGAMG